MNANVSSNRIRFRRDSCEQDWRGKNQVHFVDRTAGQDNRSRAGAHACRGEGTNHANHGQRVEAFSGNRGFVAQRRASAGFAFDAHKNARRKNGTHGGRAVESRQANQARPRQTAAVHQRLKTREKLKTENYLGLVIK